jgi:hypothetical protein
VDRTIAKSEPLDIRVVVERTVELMEHAEAERKRLGLPSVVRLLVWPNGWDSELSMLGAFTEDALKNLRADKLFMGIHVDYGILADDMTEVQSSRTLWLRPGRSICSPTTPSSARQPPCARRRLSESTEALPTRGSGRPMWHR